MKFRTEIDIAPLGVKIGYGNRILALGSCFAEHIARRLAEARFRIVTNPTGILFNPLSIAAALRSYADETPVQHSELDFDGELWFHYGFHGSLSAASPDEALAAMNAARKAGAEALRRAGADVIVINASPDGYNINKNAGSTHPEQLQAMVKATDAVMGVAFDGDADRCLAVDEDGNMINGDQIMGILARAKQREGKLNHDTLVVTVMSNLGLKLALKDMGIKTVETAVGDRYVLEEMLKGDYSLGGEQSGHVINREFATTGDGTLTALTLCNEVVKSGKSLKELAADFPQLPQTLINVPNVDKKAASTNKRIQDAVAREEELLGDTGRVLLRPSGTEPLVRVMAEAATQAYADEVCTRLAKIVAEELAL